MRLGSQRLFLLQDHRAWTHWSLAPPHGFFKLGGPELMSSEHGAAGSRWVYGTLGVGLFWDTQTAPRWLPIPPGLGTLDAWASL